MNRQLSTLRGLLPDQPSVGGDLDADARWALGLLVGVAAPAPPSGAVSHPNACPNCGSPVASMRTPYCSEGCRDESAFVRQMRSALADGTILDAGKQSAMGQVLWRLIGGGRPYRRGLLTKRAVERVIEREGGRCQVCDGPATTIDHAGSG